MLERCSYMNHLGEWFNFGSESGVYVNYNDLRDFQFSVDSNSNRIRKLSRNQIVSKTLPLVIFTDPEKADEIKNRLYEIMAKDSVKTSYGRIYVGRCYYQCYMSGSEKSNYLNSKEETNINIELSTDQPYWIREVRKDFDPSNLEVTNRVGEARVGYAMVSGIPQNAPDGTLDDASIGAVLENTFWDSCDCDILIYGPAESPYVMIGNNVYSVNVSVPDGQILQINTKLKQIWLYNENMQPSNVFDLRNKRYNTFQKVPAGYNRVVWNGTYKIAITLLEEWDEPIWT